MFTLQALDAEGFARPLVESDYVGDLIPLLMMLLGEGHDVRIWDRQRQQAFQLETLEAVCALL